MIYDTNQTYPETFTHLMNLVSNGEWCRAWLDNKITDDKRDIYTHFAQEVWMIAQFESSLDRFNHTQHTSEVEQHHHNHVVLGAGKNIKEKTNRCSHPHDVRIARYLISSKDPCSGLSEITVNQLDEFANSIVYSVATDRKIDDILSVQKILFYIIKRGNDINLWKLCYPTLMFRVSRKPPRTTHDSIPQLEYGITLFDAFKETIMTNTIKTDQIISYLLMSAFLYDGCVTKKALKHLTCSISSQIRYKPNSCWIDIYDDKNRIYRRIYPSPLTLRFWCECTMDNLDIINPEREIENLANKLISDEHRRFNYIRNAVIQVMAEYLPESLISIAEDHPRMQPISTARWSSIMSPENINEGITEHPQFIPDEFPNKTSDNNIDVLSDTLTTLMDSIDLNNLRDAIRGNDINNIRNNLSELSFKHRLNHPISQLLALWLIDLTQKKTISVVKRFFSSLVARLIDTIGDSETTSLDEDLLSEIFGRIIDSGESPSNRNMIRLALKSFVDFISTDVNNGILHVFVSAYEKEFASANIITSEEHLAALDRIRNARHTYHKSDLTQLLIVSEILFFRAGFRKNELLFVPPHDVHIHTNDIEIHAKSHKYRITKTLSSERTLSMRALLPEDEYNIVRAYLIDRLDSLKKFNNEKYVFTIPGTDQKNLSNKIADLLTITLRQVTGDQNLTLHHLRHSFVTWLLLSLMSNVVDIDISLFSHLPKTTQYLNFASRSLQSHVYFDTCEDTSLMYLAAYLVGHANPGTTIESYSHLLDIVISNAIYNALHPLSPEFIHYATGIPVRTIRRYKKTSSYRANIFLRMKKLHKHRFIKPPTKPSIKLKKHTKTDTFLNRYKEAFHAMSALCQNHGHNIRQYPISNDMIHHAYHRYTFLRTKYTIFEQLFDFTENIINSEFIDKISKLFKNDPSSIAPLNDALVISYLNFVDTRTFEVIFDSSFKAKEYIENLRMVGLRYSDLNIRLVGRSPSQTAARKTLSIWRKKIELPRSVRISESLKITKALKKNDNAELFITITSESDNSAQINAGLMWLFLMYAIIDGQFDSNLIDEYIFL